jgi:G3E family GTPase
MMRYRLDGVIALVDAVHGAATLDQHAEAVKQAAVADRIVLTKTDLLDTPELHASKDQLVARLRALNPAAPIIEALQASPARLLDCGLYDPARKNPDVKRWLAEEAYAAMDVHDQPHHHDRNRHDARIRAFTLATERPIPAAAFDDFLELLRSMHGPNLLRFKGVVKIAEHLEQPLVVHGVQHLLHPPVRLARWPDDDHRTRLVFIVRDTEPRVVRELFGAFLGAAAPDRPDRAALTDNPLVPFGGADR